MSLVTRGFGSTLIIRGFSFLYAAITKLRVYIDFLTAKTVIKFQP